MFSPATNAGASSTLVGLLPGDSGPDASGPATGLWQAVETVP